MVKFLKGWRFIIKTAIRLITKLPIWNVSQGENTKDSPRWEDLKIRNTERSKDCTCLKSGKTQNVMSGIGAKRGMSGMLLMLKDWLLILFQKNLNVLVAELKRIQEVLAAASGVQESASIVATKENCERKDVYNLSVEENHEYFANGVLVSNCFATIYAILALDRTCGEEGGVKTWGGSEKAINHDIAPDIKKMIEDAERRERLENS
jgi:hypothetical protein